MSSLCSAVDYNSKGLFKCICNQVNYLGRKIKAKVTLTLLGRISNFLYWRFPYPCHRRSFETHDNSLLKKIILIVGTKKLKGEIRLNKRIKNKMGEQTKLSQFREIFFLRSKYLLSSYLYNIVLMCSLIKLKDRFFLHFFWEISEIKTR